MNVARLVLRWGSESPDVPAVIEGKRSLSFRELGDASARAAGMFRRSGLRPGDAVLVWLPMGIELYVLLAGLWRAGLTAVAVDPSAGWGLISRSLGRMPPDGFVGTFMAQGLRLALPEGRRIPRAWSTGPPLLSRSWGRWRAEPPDPAVEDVPDDQPALITFTSGTTGTPKGVVRSHGFLRAQHAAVARALGHRPGDMTLATLPIFALSDLASGQSVLIPDADLRRPGSVRAGPVVAQVLRHRPRSAVASPAFFERLAEWGDALYPLRAVYVGGGPVFPSAAQRLRRLAPEARLIAVYGSTEAEPIAELDLEKVRPEEWAAVREGKGLPAGEPVPGLGLAVIEDQWGVPQAALAPEAFEASRLPPGQPGEIVVSGAHVLMGYLDGAGDAENKIKVGDRVWHRTGDAGYLDPRGRLWLLGRCSAKIEDGKGRIYPFSVEAAAMARDGVRRAGLVGLNGRRVLAVEGESACLEGLKGDLSWARLDRVVRRRIPLDRRHNAKVDYAKLARLLKT